MTTKNLATVKKEIMDKIDKTAQTRARAIETLKCLISECESKEEVFDILKDMENMTTQLGFFFTRDF